MPRKNLPLHATTCIKQRIATVIKKSDCDGDAFETFCDLSEGDCITKEFLIAGEKAVVNVKEDGFLSGTDSHRVQGVCAFTAELDLDIEIYYNACHDDAPPVDYALAVLAYVTKELFMYSSSTYHAKNLTVGGVEHTTDGRFSESIAKVTQRIQLTFDFSPEEPNTVFVY